MHEKWHMKLNLKLSNMEQPLSNKQFAENLVSGFYHRPAFEARGLYPAGGEHPDYKAYREDDESRWVQVFEVINKYGKILNITMVVHPLSGELTVIIDTDMASHLLHTKKEEIEKFLVREIRSEAGESVYLDGAEYYTLIIKESY